jgi:hypothetical protein
MADVSNPSQWRKDMEARWDRSRSLLGGTDTMRKRGVVFLPRFPDESASSWEYRLSLATLNNFYRRMARTMMGYLFARPVELQNCELPEEFLENVDGRGRDVNQFCRLLAWHVLTRGLALPFVDYPVIPKGLTLAQEKALGARPVWKAVNPDTSVAGFAAEDKGPEVITHFRWYDNKVEPYGEWEEQCVERIRVLDTLGIGRDAAMKKLKLGDDFMSAPAVFMLYQATTQGVWEPVDAGVIDLDKLPLHVIYAERESFMVSRPPLDDVSWKNIHHWRLSSNLEHILELSAFPTQYQVGTDDAVNTVGPSILLHSTNENAEFGYIEPGGSGIEANERALERLVNEAEMLGFQLLHQKKGNPESASGRVLDETKSTSPLQDLSLALEEGINQALVHTAEWYDLDPKKAGYAVVNREYGVDPEMLRKVDMILRIRAQGDMTVETMYSLLRECGVVPRDFDIEKEAAEVERMIKEEFDRNDNAGNEPE